MEVSVLSFHIFYSAKNFYIYLDTESPGFLQIGQQDGGIGPRALGPLICLIITQFEDILWEVKSEIALKS